MTFSRKVGRLVAVRYPPGPTNPNPTQLRPARITAVGDDDTVTVQVLHPDAESYADLPRWSREAPDVAGWVRT
jgi:hypothetical protein